MTLFLKIYKIVKICVIVVLVIHMKIFENDNTIEILNITDFNPEHIFMCGQCFRWDENEDKSYTGVAFDKVINVSLFNNKIIIKNTTKTEFETRWKHYLDLDTDYSEIKKTFSKDVHISRAMDFGWGIRILNQDVFECLISFIISTQNTIPRIKKIVSRLCENFGKKLEYDNKTYYAFPTLDDLADVNEDDLAFLKAGYRASYIVDAIRKLASGEVSLEKIRTMTYTDAKKELMKIKGVGPKVADCVLLFSCEKKEAFPIDVWVKRTMQTLYLDESASPANISEFANDYFGQYAGVAQQYLFYHARENS